jgi:hypothetical protein
MAAFLDRLGRQAMDPFRSDVDGDDVWPWVAALYEDARADPEGFVTDLEALAATTTGGFATYGASRLVWELLGAGMRTEAALLMLDRAIEFKRERGLAPAHLTGYERDRWLEVHSPGTWWG